MELNKKSARLAGVLYLLLAITSIFGLVYVPSKLIVAGDITNTIKNILISQALFRLGIISNLLYLVIFVLLAHAFYNLFKDVNKNISMVMLSLVLVAIPVAFVNELNHFAVLLLLNSQYFLKDLGPAQVEMVVHFFLDLYTQLSFMVMIFWGIWLFPLGILVLKSKFMPKLLGYLLIIGCFGYVISSFTFLFSPSFGKIIFPIITIPSALAEVLLILWLLIKGTSEVKIKNSIY